MGLNFGKGRVLPRKASPMGQMISEEDRRKFERHRVDDQESFTLCPHCPGLGPIVDISLGGLSFFFEGESLPDKNKIDILFGNDLLCIKNIPCQRILWDLEPEAKGKKKNRPVKRGSIEFGSLSPKQKTQINYLIEMSKSHPGDFFTDFCLEIS